MKLIAGLGNPGRGYANIRHNLGFMCLNHFARTHNIRLDKKLGQAHTGKGEVAGGEVVVARPQTYMNRSGQAVSRLVKRYKVVPEDVIIIHDDLDLAPGKIRIRQGGGSGGHKGINSIIAELGNRDFLRIRVGIGRPAGAEGSTEIAEDDIISYVLSDFALDEKPIITRVIPVVSDAILCLLTEGLTAAMNKYN